jgi:hypothetical protein
MDGFREEIKLVSDHESVVLDSSWLLNDDNELFGA